MENKGAPSPMSQSFPGLPGVMPFADSSSISRRYWEHLLHTSFKKCHWRCLCCVWSLWSRHHLLDQDDLKSAAFQVCCQVGSPQNCPHSSLEVIGSRQGCAYGHTCTIVATVSEEQHADRQGQFDVTISYFTTFPKGQVQICPVPGNKSESFGLPGLQGNRLIHLSHHADKLSSDISSSCLNTSLVKSISLLTRYSFYSFPH